MVDIRIRVGSPSFRRSGLFARHVQLLCEELVTADRMIIRAGEVPPLYLSGVRYQHEPPGIESFDSAYDVYRRGWGDCDDLASWRCAELLETSSERGTWKCPRTGIEYVTPCIRITWIPHPRRGSGRLYHVTVRKADGSIEDPSLKLGMSPGG